MLPMNFQRACAQDVSTVSGEAFPSAENTLTRSEVFAGRYFFHFHTLLTDGKLSLDEYFSFAAAARVTRLVFLEHIRRQPNYDVRKFAAEIQAASEKWQIDAALGFETKLLPTGALDISEEHFGLAQVIGIAEHGFPRDLNLLSDVMQSTFPRYRSIAPEKTFVWVHPGTTFRKLNLDPSRQQIYTEMIRCACANGVLLEKNLRYGLMPQPLIEGMHLGDHIVLGADAHNHDDLAAWTTEAGFMHPLGNPQHIEAPEVAPST